MNLTDESTIVLCASSLIRYVCKPFPKTIHWICFMIFFSIATNLKNAFYKMVNKPICFPDPIAFSSQKQRSIARDQFSRNPHTDFTTYGRQTMAKYAIAIIDKPYDNCCGLLVCDCHCWNQLISKDQIVYVFVLRSIVEHWRSESWFN